MSVLRGLHSERFVNAYSISGLITQSFAGSHLTLLSFEPQWSPTSSLQWICCWWNHSLHTATGHCIKEGCDHLTQVWSFDQLHLVKVLAGYIHLCSQLFVYIRKCTVMNPLYYYAGFSLGLNDRAQRPVVLFSALSFFLSALSFFQRPVIFRELFGFFGLSSALFWAWSCRKRPIKAKGGAIFEHHVVIRVGYRHHLGFTMNIYLWKLCALSFFKTS